VIDEGGLLLSGVAIGKIMEDDWFIDRCSGFSLLRIRLLFPQSKMPEHEFYGCGFGMRSIF